MKKANIKRWAEKAKQKGFVNVNKISTSGIDNYHIDCGEFAWVCFNSDEFAYLLELCPQIRIVNK